MEIKNESLRASEQDVIKKDKENSGRLAHKIAELLDEKKAQKITLIDISSKTNIADYFVICSARSSTMVRALVDHVDEKMSKEGLEPKGRDIDTKWAAIDYVGVIVHIFYHETREFYNLERLWETETNTEYFN